MSKDWTPQETITAENYLNETRGKTMRDKKVLIAQPDGSLRQVGSNKEYAYRRKYKELGFLYNRLYQVYLKFSKHPKYLARILNDIECKLSYYVKYNRCENENDVVWLWYTGRLDPNFYYRKHNDELFEEYITAEVNKLINKRR
jgi:hypothetical protein